MEESAIIIARARWSLPHCLFLPLYFHCCFCFSAAFLISQNLSLNLAVVCCSMIASSGSAPSFRFSVRGHLTDSASQLSNAKFLSETSWWAQCRSDVHPVVQSSALGNRLLSRHMEVHASWHVQSSLFRGSTRAAEELWTAVRCYFCQSTGAVHVSKCSGQVFRTPAAGTWSLCGSQSIGPFKIWNSCQC